MFVPKGCVLLTAAVDRLAEARRTAAQANDDGKNAARVGLRAEFHSGSMLATIVHPKTGETHTIFPERWALEEALTWLEQGKCLLTSGLVCPRLGISFNNDPTVNIFVSEHDLQRLIAQQATKQEYSDQRSETQPASPVQTITRHRLAEARIEPEFRRWREQHPSGYIPTESEDAGHMKQFGVGRDKVRELREKYPRRPRGLKKSDKPPNIRG